MASHENIISREQIRQVQDIACTRGAVKVAELKKQLGIEGVNVSTLAKAIADSTELNPCILVNNTRMTWTVYYEPEMERLVMEAVKQYNAEHTDKRAGLWEVTEQIEKAQAENRNLMFWKLCEQLDGRYCLSVPLRHLWVLKALIALTTLGKLKSSVEGMIQYWTM